MLDIFDEITTDEAIEESLPPRKYEKLPISRGIVQYRNRFLLLNDIKPYECPDTRWEQKPGEETGKWVETGLMCLKFIQNVTDLSAIEFNESLDAREDLSESEKEDIKEPERYTIFEKQGQHVFVSPKLDGILALFEEEKARTERGEDVESRFPAKIAYMKGPHKNSRIVLKSHSWLREQHELFKTSKGEEGVPPLETTRQPFFKSKTTQWDK